MPSITPVIELLERSGIRDYTMHRIPDDTLRVTVHEHREDAGQIDKFRLWLRTTYSVSSHMAEPSEVSFLLPEPQSDPQIDLAVRTRVGDEDVVFFFQAKYVDTPQIRSAENPTYDGDFAAWAYHQAALIREARWGDIDTSNLAEEIDDLSKRQQHELRSRLRVLIAHVLKWDQQRERRSRSWAATIREQQAQIEDILAASPSLAGLLPGYSQAAYDTARDLAELETGLPLSAFPAVLPYTVEQLLSMRPNLEDGA